MCILVILSITLTIAGVVGLARKVVPESISGAVWAKSEKLRWAWSWWIACVAFSLMVPLMNALDDVAWLGWLTVVCLLGAGYPMFRDESRHWHKVCAVAAGVLSQVCVACLCPWWLLIWAVWLPLLAGAVAALNDAEEMPCLMAGHSVFVAECTCAVSLYGCLLCVM